MVKLFDRPKSAPARLQSSPEQLSETHPIESDDESSVEQVPQQLIDGLADTKITPSQFALRGRLLINFLQSSVPRHSSHAQPTLPMRPRSPCEDFEDSTTSSYDKSSESSDEELRHLPRSSS